MERLKMLQDKYIGKTIELISMSNDPDPIEHGTKGEVTGVYKMPDNEYQFDVNWENGRTLSAIYPVDKFRLVGG